MSSDMTAAHQARARAAEGRKLSIAEEVAVLLANPLINDELKRKLEYCQEEIARGRDGGLVASRTKLMAEANRRTY